MIKSHFQNGYFPLFRLLPNLVTLIAICIGLTAIRFAMEGQFVKATAFVIIAAFMDAVDGRLARFLNSTSDFGAQLDSLADFANFGVVPGFVVYFWVNSFADVRGLDWAMVLLFAMCDAIRLARFNVDSSKEPVNPILEKYFFKGIPAPCGASMAMLPMVLTYEFGDGFYTNPLLVISYVIIVALLMASRVPTISIKKIPVRNEYVHFTLLVLGVIVIGLLVEPWFTLACVGSAYAISIPITIFYFFKLKNNAKKS
jgi:CDP-diacylglycerol--serine O-phosphatidyltransferase